MATTYSRTPSHNVPLGALPGSTNYDGGPSSRRRDPEQNTYAAAPRSPTRRREALVASQQAAQPAAAPAEKKEKKKPAQEKPTSLPDPPETVRDSDGVEWTRGRMLGSGGFARVYDAISSRGEMRAFKVIAKKHLQSKKTRQKILAEIMIHSSFKHPNVVRFEQAFEDDEHVYFKLELCKAGSMNDMVKKRGKYTDAEARFFMVQILAGCQGMHTHNIIHRDLKLGNIFLDEGMNVKIGDFGLAALLKEVGERKKTVCGTPNYIAPEILYDDGEGHSFEVDVWSVGVILYTMLVGRPPFQTSDIQKIYARIKNNDYAIPEEAGLRPEAEELITQILTPKPSDRPSLVEIMNHPWFSVGAMPTFIPMHATRTVPRLNLPTNQAESLRNLEYVQRKSQWIPNADEIIEDEEDALVDPREELKQQELLEEEREKMDMVFKRAIQPASPISALLKASRHPLVKASAAGTSSASSSQAAKATSGDALARQLSALNISRAQSQNTLASTAVSINGKLNAAGEREKSPVVVPLDKENAIPAAGSGSMGPPRNFPSVRRGLDVNSAMGGAPSSEFEAAEERRMLGQKARLVAGMSGVPGQPQSRPPTASEDEAPLPTTATPPPTSSSNIDVMIHYLNEAILSADAGVSYSPLGHDGKRASVDLRELVAPDPRVFVISWLDHSEKYGLGYALSDGTVGVYFRDSTSMSLSCSRSHCDYMPSNRRRAASTVAKSGNDLEVKRENYPLQTYNELLDLKANIATEDLPFPADLHPKVKVLRYFEQEIMERLYGADSPLTFRDETIESGMTFVFKWYRCHQAIVFRMSSGIVQFNFYDHTKIFLSADGLIVSIIPPTELTGNVQTMKSYYLSEVVSIANPERSSREAEAMESARRTGTKPALRQTTPVERRTVRSMLKKLRYAKDVLVTTTTSGSTPAATPESSRGGPAAASSRAVSAAGTTAVSRSGSAGSTASARTLVTAAARR
ncbi:unnamed protein product [Parajaminaea phylloscopi]